MPTLYLNGSEMQYTDSMKYLGVYLNTDFKDDVDIQMQLRSLYASAITVIANFYHCSLPVTLSRIILFTFLLFVSLVSLLQEILCQTTCCIQ